MAHMYDDKGFQTSCIVSEKRATRPRILTQQEAQCPFCKENQSMIEEVIDEVYIVDDCLRIVKNKYPIVDETLGGVHDVVIDTMYHHKKPREYTLEHWTTLWEMIQRRIVDLANQDFALIQLFKNSGTEAGASIAHEHWQIIALKERPLTRQNHYQCVKEAINRGECSICNNKVGQLEQEGKWQSIVPTYPTVAREIWITTSQHNHVFERWNHEDFLAISKLIKQALQGYYELYGEMAYNICLMMGPKEDVGSYHEVIKLLPRTTKIAGFELATGCMVHEISAETFYNQMKSALEERASK